MDSQIKITLITNLCTHYKKRFFEKLSQRYDAEFFFHSDGREDYWERNNPLGLGSFKGEYLSGFWLGKKLRINPSLISKIIKTNSDIIVKDIPGRFSLPATFLLAKLKGIPFILRADIWQHPETFFHSISFPFLKLIYRYSDAICVWGEHIKRYLVSLGVDEKKIFVAIQAVDNPQYAKEVGHQEIKELKESLGIGSRKIILFASQIETHKGIYYLIEAMEKFNHQKVVLLVIGSGSQLEKTKRIVRERNMDNVIFLGYIDNALLYRYYALADIFVLPSISTREYKEPWGLVINEAMNQNCPIVATTAVGAAAGGMVQDGINGYIIPEKDSSKLYEALHNILSDERLRKAMSLQAKETIQHWTYEQTLEGFRKAITFALGGCS